MASPLYDALSIQHSKNIGDPVAAAATSGKVWSTTQRDFHLNLACKQWVGIKITIATSSESRGVGADFHWESLGAYVKESSSTALSSNTLAYTGVSPNIYHVVAMYNVTSSLPIIRWSIQKQRFLTSTGGNKFLTASSTQQYYVVDGGNIRVLGSGATDSVYVRYVAVHTDLSAGGASDILVPAPYWGQILGLALAIAKQDIATAEAQQISQAERTLVQNAISQS